MDAKDLMIGDWVIYRGEPTIVYEIDDYYQRINTEPDGYDSIKCIEISEIEPIPLTSEILEKNGFKNDGEEKNMLYWNWSICEDCVSYDKETGIIRIFHCLGSLIFVKPLRYVHELQHALRLCEIEKEIIL